MGPGKFWEESPADLSLKGQGSLLEPVCMEEKQRCKQGAHLERVS